MTEEKTKSIQRTVGELTGLAGLVLADIGIVAAAADLFFDKDVGSMPNAGYLGVAVLVIGASYARRYSYKNESTFDYLNRGS